MQTDIASRPLRASLGGLTLAAAIACLLGAVPPRAAAASEGDGDVGRVCESVVGLSPGEKHYAACVDSLSESRHGLMVGEGYGVARRGCLAQGYRPNTSGLAECELVAAPATATRGPDYPAPIPGGSRSYFVVSRETAFARDQLACARLGFDPTQSPFNDCAADLRAALARASMPAM
jgi:hypothetical protein